MNVETAEMKVDVEHTDGVIRPPDAELTDALIAHCGMHPKDVARVRDAMASLHLGFADAAVQLGLATRDDVEEVTGWVRERGTGDTGVIETAMRSVQNTSLTVRQGLLRPNSRLLNPGDADRERTETIRALRTDLMLLNDSAQRGNVFALVSPGRGEGRSQLCAELAIAFAQLGRRTLLVDADLRHPRQHLLFNSDNQWGLAQSLDLGQPPYLHGVEGLPEMAVLTAGPQPPNPQELVSNRRFERLVNEMRRQYDFIVVDTPAISECADALQIATVAQRVLVVSRAEATSMASMKDMLRRLAVTESKILGAVLNRF
jgi:receptor protein-tyrosine kinase